MPLSTSLFDIAYKKERTAGRRRAKILGISEEEALRQTLESAAGVRSLAELVSMRLQEQAGTRAKRAAREQAQVEMRARKALAATPDPTAWLAWFDGSSHPNPGKMGIGGLLKSPDGRTATISCAAGQGDSSVAEYLALIAVLDAAIHAQAAKLVIHGDSQVVIDDVQTADDRGARILAPHRQQAQHLLDQLGDVRLIWIPRRKNAQADALSQQAVAKNT